MIEKTKAFLNMHQLETVALIIIMLSIGGLYATNKIWPLPTRAIPCTCIPAV